MTTGKSLFKQIFGLALIMLLLSGCGGSAPASSSSPGLGTPVSGGKWEVTITNARAEKQLMGSDGTRYTPNSGFTFLVVDATFRNLDSSQETKITADSIAVMDRAGEVFKNVGSGFALTYSLGGAVTYSNDQSNSLKLGLVFSVKTANIDQAFNFQFMDVPPIAFTVKSK